MDVGNTCKKCIPEAGDLSSWKSTERSLLQNTKHNLQTCEGSHMFFVVTIMDDMSVSSSAYLAQHGSNFP